MKTQLCLNLLSKLRNDSFCTWYESITGLVGPIPVNDKEDPMTGGGSTVF